MNAEEWSGLLPQQRIELLLLGRLMTADELAQIQAKWRRFQIGYDVMRKYRKRDQMPQEQPIQSA